MHLNIALGSALIATCIGGTQTRQAGGGSNFGGVSATEAIDLTESHTTGSTHTRGQTAETAE